MAPSRNGLVSNTCERSPKGRSTKGKLYIEMLFAVLQTQNISVLLFIIVYDRIFGRLYESFGVLKPRKKSFLMDENSEMPTQAVFLCVGTQLLSRQSNWCQNILPPISTRRKPEKTVDSRSEKGLGQEFL